MREVLRKFGAAQVINFNCPCCEFASESIDHLFLLCDWANKLWRCCMGWWGISGCSNSSINDWMDGWFGLCPSVSRKRVWNTLFFAVIWTIWEVRNEVVFRRKDADFSVALDSIKFRTALWFKSHGCGSNIDLTLLMLDLNDRCVDIAPTKKKSIVQWCPPMDNDLFFNVDGSARGNPGDAGIGGVLRDSTGKVLCLFSFFVGISDSNTAEVLAVHRACQLISSKTSLAGRMITIISDSKSAVS